MLVDLHTHTTASDGTMTLKELYNYALNKGLTHLAVTDHDTVESFSIYQELSDGAIPLIKGIELGCLMEGFEVHILGYFLDIHSERFASVLARLALHREERILKMISKLNSIGIKLDISEVEKKCSGVKGRLHIARILIDKGIVADEDEAFRRYLSRNGMAYVPRRSLSVSEGIKLIKSAGGISVLAHAFVSGLNDEQIDRIISLGIDGIEVFYPEHSLLQKDYLIKKADASSLVVTGGSDFHGFRNNTMMPIGVADYPEKYFNAFLRRGLYAG